MPSIVKTRNRPQQCTPVVALGILKNSSRRPLFDHPTEPHDNNILKHEPDNLDVMAYEQIR